MPGCIQVSSATHELLTGHTFTPSGGIEVKGKGLMETFIWNPEDHPEEQFGSVREQAMEAVALLSHLGNKLPLLPPDLASAAASCINGNSQRLQSRGQSSGQAINALDSMKHGMEGWFAHLMEVRSSHGSAFTSNTGIEAALSRGLSSQAAGGGVAATNGSSGENASQFSDHQNLSRLIGALYASSSHPSRRGNEDGKQAFSLTPSTNGAFASNPGGAALNRWGLGGARRAQILTRPSKALSGSRKGSLDLVIKSNRSAVSRRRPSAESHNAGEDRCFATFMTSATADSSRR